jgi:hypothetical protein
MTMSWRNCGDFSLRRSPRPRLPDLPRDAIILDPVSILPSKAVTISVFFENCIDSASCSARFFSPFRAETVIGEVLSIPDPAQEMPARLPVSSTDMLRGAAFFRVQQCARGGADRSHDRSGGGRGRRLFQQAASLEAVAKIAGLEGRRVVGASRSGQAPTSGALQPNGLAHKPLPPLLSS